jgi:hypothetical protein
MRRLRFLGKRRSPIATADPPFAFGQAGGPVGQVIERNLRCVENGSARGRDVTIGAVEPGFGVGVGEREVLIAVV